MTAAKDQRTTESVLTSACSSSVTITATQEKAARIDQRTLWMVPLAVYHPLLTITTKATPITYSCGSVGIRTTPIATHPTQGERQMQEREDRNARACRLRQSTLDALRAYDRRAYSPRFNLSVRTPITCCSSRMSARTKHGSCLMASVSCSIFFSLRLISPDHNSRSAG